ncbi:aldo/keto reductase [Trueperella abortisuis]|uniref:Aryl-alcohol dehydrogenase-like predicted oxidoreductase n=1 Tax=Trueperella abortisuis TaxID=445930 RepID=A0ABT9PH99_9ACTO|nr:aldo/keto reductase [Trueperella abortisuis]MDP9832086.1 aryl-alcohol dehydrogenase-like predicted oxidoreductase [Trueperella abortisuis]
MSGGDMECRRMGESGLTVSVLGYGANNLGRAGTMSEDEKGAAAVVNAALEAGITYFDSANVYGKRTGLSEKLLGKALGARREEVVIATKFGMRLKEDSPVSARGSRGYMLSCLEDSLRRLDTDYIDLYYYHSPDPRTPLEETVDALESAVDQGKIRYYAVSNMAGWQTAATAQLASRGKLVATQNHYNLIDRRAEQEILPAARYYGLGVVPYFPLAAGLLTGKYTDAVPEGGRLKAGDPKLEAADMDQLRRYRGFCEERGFAQADLAIAWLAHQDPVASIIAGATRPEQIASNAKAVDIELDDADLAALDEIFPPAGKVALF